MNKTALNPKKWEIWWAYVRYEDSPEIKKRPVLVVSDNTAYILSFKITTHKPRKEFDGEYLIENWKSAGLKHQSTVRMSKVIEMNSTDFVDKIGNLHPYDILNVQNIWTRIHK